VQRKHASVAVELGEPRAGVPDPDTGAIAGRRIECEARTIVAHAAIASARAAAPFMRHTA